MYKFIVRKAFASVITLFVIVVLFYFLFVGVKGNPLEAAKYLSQPGGEESYAQALKFYGINDPIYVRFWDWLTGVFHGDWGPVYNYHVTNAHTIPQMFFHPLKWSMWIFIPSYFIGMFIGLGLGYWAGYKRGKATDVVINFILTIFIAIPGFILAAFVLLASFYVNIPINFMNPKNPGSTTALFIKSLIPAIVVVSLTSLAGWAYFLRIEVGNILISDYVLSARTRGYTGWFIFRRYVMRNSLYPLISNIVTSYMVIFSGSLVVEQFFSVPGTSTMILAANKNGEVNILMFQLIFFSSIGVFSQMLVDIVQYTINPVVKSNFSSKPSPFKKYKAYKLRNKDYMNQQKNSTKTKRGARWLK